MKKFFILIPLISFNVQANDGTLCAEKVALLRSQGKLNVSCSDQTAVDMGNRTFSADYQEADSKPLSHAAQSLTKKVKGDPNYPFYKNIQKGQQYGIGWSYYLTEQVKPIHGKGSELNDYEKAHDFGAPATDVIYNAVKSVLPQEAGFLDYLGNSDRQFKKDLKAEPGASSWNGSCMSWSAWNVSSAPLDLEFKSLLNQMGRGILCDGKWPLSAGVLKELWTALTIEPRDDAGSGNGNFQALSLNSAKTYEEAGSRTAADVEDANLALVKLQDFGAGSDFKPESIIAMAKDARANHSKLVFDMNPGVAVWNQPVETMVEVTYEDPRAGDAQKYLTVADLRSGPSPEVWTELLRLENSMKENALSGDKSQTGGLCRVRSMIEAKGVGESCADLPAEMPLATQVNELKRIQYLALQKGLVSKISNQPIIHHQIFIQYGTEGDFGDSNNLKSPTRVLEYVKVGDRPGAWTSPTKKLTEACGDHHFGKRDEVRDSLYAKVSDECIVACNQSPKFLPAACGSEREIFTGSLPPKNFKILKRRDNDQPQNANNQDKIDAQKNILKLIKKCPSYDAAAQFLDRLKLDLSKNKLSPSEINALADQYSNAKSFLSRDFLLEATAAILPEGALLGDLKQGGALTREKLDFNHSNSRIVIPGWDELKRRLK